MSELQKLRLRNRELEIRRGTPQLMGIVNCTPDSFSDQQRSRTVQDRVRLGKELAAAGAAIIDVGGESGVTHRPDVDADEEIGRVLPVVEEFVAQGLIVSVDTWKPKVAEAVLDAGAHMINDVSAVREPELLNVVAKYDASIVLMHTRAAPKREYFPDYGGRVAADVRNLLAGLRERALAAGIKSDSIVLDPGPDFAKTPAESVDVLRDLPRLSANGHPLLLAVSRKYFIGAALDREPDQRIAGTLATLGWCADRVPFSIARIHDVAQAADYLKMRSVLDGSEPMPQFRRDDKRLQWLHNDVDDQR